MPNLYMLVGLPGVGKSYWISNKFIPTSNNYHVVSTDYYIDQIAGALRITYNEAFDAIKLAEKLMYKHLDIAVAKDYDIIWDQTNLSKNTRAKKLAKIPSHYNKYCVNFLLPEIEIWNLRLNRPGKYISEKIINSMKMNYEEPLLSEGFNKIITVGTDSNYISQLENAVV